MPLQELPTNYYLWVIPNIAPLKADTASYNGWRKVYKDGSAPGLWGGKHLWIMGPAVDSCTPDASIFLSALPGLKEAVVWDVISVRVV